MIKSENHALEHLVNEIRYVYRFECLDAGVYVSAHKAYENDCNKTFKMLHKTVCETIMKRKLRLISESSYDREDLDGKNASPIKVEVQDATFLARIRKPITFPNL